MTKILVDVEKLCYFCLEQHLRERGVTKRFTSRKEIIKFIEVSK